MKKLLTILLLFAAPVFAQDSRPTGDTAMVASDTAVLQDVEVQDVEAQDVEQETEKPGTNDGYINLRAGVDFTTHYFSRGILQENQGVIGQPWIEAEIRT